MLDFLRQFAPVSHHFQIGFSSFRVFCFLRCGVAFQRLYSEPFRSRRHQDQPGAIRPVPSIRRAAPFLVVASFVFPLACRNKPYSHAIISRSPRWTTGAPSTLPARRRNSRDGRRRAIALRRLRRQVGGAIRSCPIRANASRTVPSVSMIKSGKPSTRPQNLPFGDNVVVILGSE